MDIDFVDRLAAFYADPASVLTVVGIVVGLAIGLIYSRQALIDLFRGKWW